ncbi:hypothetical protein [Leptospira noguchii]|uniref:Uncharacterized protein n=1 Tax=Leptospira noguchii TaxID=28182 RepID=A0A9Q8VTY6_9LEPT|nr:hypothetical protein [Leptospira noguchii]TQE61103.1 hypothetical protein FF021_21435 [Leptospira noguchii]UOG30977.1 hypothetical protein MAL06_02540 [Leptospira noguchii]UOG53127.1 hypothetical protein MAL09_02630 [Leptospira noguchii]UOG57098.1 hypothetical protein MAL03_02520 [Leptospira noguchii]
MKAKGIDARELKQNALYGSRSKLKFKSKYCITFLLCNLFTRAESPVAACGSWIRPNFLTLV